MAANRSNGNTKKKTTASSGKKTVRSSKTKAAEDTSFLQSEAAVLGTFAVCVFLFLSNFHICGMVGDVLSQVMLGVFGSIGYIAPLLLFAGMLFYASNRGNIRAVYKMLAVEILLIVLCGLAQLTFGGGYQEGQTLFDVYESAGISGKGGGVIGGALVLVLHTAVGTIGSYLILLLFLIISIVCITEKSFVSAVRKGGGRAYQHAREDYDRRRVIREEKKEERRILREEQKVSGVNLKSTDLAMEEPPVMADRALKRQAGPDGGLKRQASHKPEAVQPETDLGYQESIPVSSYTSSWKPMPGELLKEPEAKEPAAKVPAAKEPDPADVFTGKIQMSGLHDGLENGEKEDEDEVPFQEDLSLLRHRQDEDVFVSRDSRDIEEMDLFPDRRKEFSAEVHPEEEIAPPKEGYPKEEFCPKEETAVSVEEESLDPGEPKTVIERKRIVTATGKVIETDAEEIIKKKRKMDAKEKEEADASVLQEIKKTEEKPKKPYVIPPLNLLTKGKTMSGQSEREFKETAVKLQQTLKNFGVGVTVTNISCGPTVTRYELHPEQGVKVSRILALADDIKLSLATADIRIEAPIPGKSAVGIEVPNRVNSTVYLRDLLESEEFKRHPSRLAFAVGKDIGGKVIVADLAKMPHLLIAGQTGSGKSVGINTMVMSLLYRSSPEDVKLIMIDPKVVELSVYNGIPHLLIPVVTDPKKAAGALNWAVAEMMERYNKFASANVRDLKGYNARVKTLLESGDVPQEEIPKKMPQIVIVIDELADLMMVASNEVEDAICRLAQLARAAGIHLVIATQRPSVNVITGVIKANIPSRIAFSVASGTDSRTILDMVGAEKLLGNGDMLFYPSGYPKPLRVQGAFVSDGEVSRVTDFLKEQNEEGSYSEEVERKVSQPSLAGISQSGSDRDELFVQAGRFIIEKDKASIGMLQRMFKIGFNRAARIMDQLAEAGVVGEEEGTKPRKVLMSAEEFEEFLESGG